MIRTTLAILSLLTLPCTEAKAQRNIVKNPSFESYSQCPDMFDQIGRAYLWSGIDSFGNQYCTPEYCNACATTIYVSIPQSGGYYQYARTGNGMAEVQTYFDESDPYPYYRDYLLGRLSETLSDGKSYCVTFYVNFAELSQYFIDKIGAYLDDGDICNVSNCSGPLMQFTPQVEYSGGLITDTLNWTKVEGTFTANGTERFITIGNFYDMANTTAVQAYTNNINYSWLLIDDVSVIESDLPAYAGPAVWIAIGDSIFIGRTPEVGLECKWYTGTTVVDSGAGIWVKPTVTTNYIVEQTLCGLVKRDTVNVQVVPLSVNGITNSRQLSVYPNPATTELHVMQERMVFKNYVIVNNLGQQVLSASLAGKENSIDISSLPTGMYYLQLSGPQGREVRSFVKM